MLSSGTENVAWRGKRERERMCTLRTKCAMQQQIPKMSFRLDSMKAANNGTR